MNLSTVGVGLFAISVWAYLPSGRQFVIKADRGPRLEGTERIKYVRHAIGWEPSPRSEELPLPSPAEVAP